METQLFQHQNLRSRIRCAPKCHERRVFSMRSAMAAKPRGILFIYCTTTSLTSTSARSAGVGLRTGDVPRGFATTVIDVHPPPRHFVGRYVPGQRSSERFRSYRAHAKARNHAPPCPIHSAQFTAAASCCTPKLSQFPRGWRFNSIESGGSGWRP